MKRTRQTATPARRSSAAPIDDASSSRSTVAPSADTPSEESTNKRVSFAMKADGTFDFDSMRASNKEALKKALSDPSLSSSLGIASTQGANDTRLLEAITGGLFDGLSFVSVAFAKRAGYPDQQAALAAFTKEEKEILSGPTVDVLNKWVPDFGGKYREEMVLGLLLVNVIGAKVLLLRSGAVINPDGSVSMPRSTVAPPRVIPINEGDSLPS